MSKLHLNSQLFKEKKKILFSSLCINKILIGQRLTYFVELDFEGYDAREKK